MLRNIKLFGLFAVDAGRVRRFLLKLILLAAIGVGLQSCMSSVVGAAVDTGIEIAKVPFKIADTAVELIFPEDKDD